MASLTKRLKRGCENRLRPSPTISNTSTKRPPARSPILVGIEFIESNMTNREGNQFNRTPVCEFLPQHPATHFLHRGKTNTWHFVSTEYPESFGDYHLEIEDFFKSPGNTVDWLAHLAEKDWFDAKDFCKMMRRFREATNSYQNLSR